MSKVSPPELSADYFDGHSARARPVQLTVRQRRLHIAGDGVALELPVRQVSWPERQRHGARQAYLPNHGMLSAPDAAAWDAWAAASGVGDSLTVRWMQSWRGALLALLLFIGVLVGSYRWGLPAAARGIVALTPAGVDEQLGTLALDSFEQRWLLPSRLAPARQAELRSRFETALQRVDEPRRLPRWTLHFRATPERGIGANAFALPGGHIVVTDALVELLADRPDVLIGVLGHELGHVQHRHGMRSLVQASLLAALSALVLGDFSSVLSAAPVLLGQAAYGRGFEFEADAAAARLMRANGSDPASFGVLFERMRAQQRGGIALPIGLSTHPPDEERMRRMQESGR